MYFKTPSYVKRIICIDEKLHDMADAVLKTLLIKKVFQAATNQFRQVNAKVCFRGNFWLSFDDDSDVLSEKKVVNH